MIEEVMLMVNMIEHLLYINAWPVPAEIAYHSSLILETAYKAANALIETSWLYKTFTERVAELIVM